MKLYAFSSVKSSYQSFCSYYIAETALIVVIVHRTSMFSYYIAKL